MRLSLCGLCCLLCTLSYLVSKVGLGPVFIVVCEVLCVREGLVGDVATEKGLLVSPLSIHPSILLGFLLRKDNHTKRLRCEPFNTPP